MSAFVKICGVRCSHGSGRRLVIRASAGHLGIEKPSFESARVSWWLGLRVVMNLPSLPSRSPSGGPSTDGLNDFPFFALSIRLLLG